MAQGSSPATEQSKLAIHTLDAEGKATLVQVYHSLTFSNALNLAADLKWDLLQLDMTNMILSNLTSDPHVLALVGSSCHRWASLTERYWREI